MEKLQLSNNKTLKLTNVLKCKINLADEDMRIDTQVERMQSYIRTKGAVQIGPLIQYTNSYVNENGEMDIDMVFMLQCNNYIYSVEQPYQMESVLRVPDCMYVRYIGAEQTLKFAYDKINLTAFEEDIPLVGDSYTIFVNHNEEEDTIVADVFMPKKKEM